MNRVNKKPLKDILGNIDLILRENDIAYFCDNMDIVKEFIQKYAGKPNKAREVKEFLIKNEKYINKEKLVLLIVKNYQDNLKIINERISELTKEISKRKAAELFAEISNLEVQYNAQKDRLQTAIKLGKGIETFLTFYYYDERKERYEVEVLDSREVIDGKKINVSKGLRRFEEIDSFFKNGDPEGQIGMEFVLQSILLTDLYNVFPDKRFGNDIRTMILENKILKEGIKTNEQLQELKTLESYEEYTELLDNVYFEGILPEVKEELRRYSQYMDLDKLLLISAYRFNEALENGYIDQRMSANAKELLQGILENVKVPNAKISCELQRKTDNSYENENIEYSIKDLRRCLTQFTRNGYVTNKEIEEYRERVDNKEISLSNIDSEYIDIIFSSEELEKLSTLTLENLLYVSQKNEWDTQKILDAIKDIGTCNVETLTELIGSGKISSEELVELYESNIIPAGAVRILGDMIDLSNSINFSRFNEYYMKLKSNPENQEVFNRYNKYLSLYKEVWLSEKTDEEIQNKSNIAIEEIVDKFEGKDYYEAIKDYFKAGVITIDSIVDWNDENIITALFNEGLISFENMEELVKNEKLTTQYLSNIYSQLIQDDNMEYNQRLQLIKSGFINELDIFDLYRKNLIFEEDLKKLAEDGIVREKVMQKIINSRTMEELEKNSSIRLTGLNGLTKKNNDIYSYSGCSTNAEKRKSTGKFIIDPNERERFIRMLNAYKANTDLNDESPFYNYEFYVIPDESGAIGLNSVVIAERYFEDKNTESKFATDNATYFFKYKDLMVLSNLKKSEMTKERRNIVFTANHVIANDKREGRWAQNVISSIVKTMMSCDLREYSKKNQRLIILQKLKDIYSSQELSDILDMSIEIDLGAYIGEIEEPILSTPKRKSSVPNIKKPEVISDEDEGR